MEVKLTLQKLLYVHNYKGPREIDCESRRDLGSLLIYSVYKVIYKNVNNFILDPLYHLSVSLSSSHSPFQIDIRPD